MADYIVKDDGTATGDGGRYTTPKSGSFATLGTSNYYGSITLAEAATTTPAVGDRILFSDLHSLSQATAINFGIAGVEYICVSDIAMEDGRRSGNRGSEGVTGSATDINYTDMSMSGLSLSSEDNLQFSGNNILSDCELTVSATTDIAFKPSIDGSNVTLINQIINIDNANAIPFELSIACSILMNGGIIATTSGGVAVLTSGGFGNGGSKLEINGADLSAITGTLIANTGSNASQDDMIDVRIDMCKLASGVAFTNETFKSFNQRVLVTRSSDSSSAAEYQYHLHAFGGDVDDDDTIRRAEDPSFEDSGTTISYKIVTNADTSLASPLWLDFPNPRWAALSAGATDTLRIYVASTATLTDKDIYIEVSYPDGTNKQTPNFTISAPSTVGGTIDLMAAGTTLTTDSGSDWRNGGSPLAGHNEYQIDVTTSGDVGADTKPIVRVYITKASTTIQLASIYDLN